MHVGDSFAQARSKGSEEIPFTTGAEPPLETRVHEALATSHEPAVMLLRLCRVLVPSFVHSCQAYLQDAAGQLERAAGSGAQTADDALLLSGGPITDRSVLVVRLAGRSHPLGALVLRRDGDRPFDEHDERRARSIGHLVSLEIENSLLIDANARARADAGRALDRADRLIHLSGALSGALTATHVTDLVLDQAKRFLGADGASIGLLTQDRMSVDIVGTSGQVATLSNEKHSAPASAYEPFADAARSGRPVYIESLNTGAAGPKFIANAPEDGALAALPLSVDDDIVGALGLHFPNRRDFSEEDRADMLALARSCADAMDRVRLYDSERRARAESGEEGRRLEVLADAGRILASPLDHPNMMQTFARSLVPGLADWCIIYTITDDRLAPIAMCHREPSRAPELAELALLDARATAPLGPIGVRNSGRPQILLKVPDRILSGLAPDDTRQRLLRAVGITSQMTFPLEVRDRTLGVLVITYAGFRRYSSSDVVFVEELARRMAIALDNAKLYRDVHESEERYRLLVEGVQDHAIFMLDPQGRIATWNSGAERLFGYAPSEVVGAPYAAFSLDDGPPGSSVLEAARRDGRHEDDGWCLRNGDRFWGNRLVTRLTASDGTERGFAVIVRDLSERAKAREALEQARSQLAATEKLSALGSLVSGVAHEIRTPLTAMSNNLHIMEMSLRPATVKHPEDDLLGNLLTRVEDAIAGVDRLNRLVEDLRRFTRVKPGTRKRMPLESIVLTAVDLFRAAHRGSIQVESSLEPTPSAEVDVTQVQQVVLNLLQNAADAMPHGGRVRVETNEHERGACIIIEDQGIGMPPEVYARMFEEFFTTKPEGTGLGLSIVRRIVESHKGSIECESLPGKGTRFTVVLPTAA